MTIIRRVFGVAGVLLMAYAIGGALTDADLDLIGVLVFLAAVLIVHDGLWMPAVLAVLAVVAGVRKKFERNRRPRGRVT